MTVDLEALKAELEAAGFWTHVNPSGSALLGGCRHPEIGDSFTVFTGDVWVNWSGAVNWQALDIIRRHVSPPEPVVLTAEEREAIASAIYEVLEDNAKTRTCDTWREVNRKQASAVLDWLAANGFALVRTKAVADGA